MEKSASANYGLVVHFRADNFADKLLAAAARDNMTVGKWVKSQILAILEIEKLKPEPLCQVTNSIDKGDKKRVSISLTSSELESIYRLMYVTKTKTVSKMLLKIIRAFMLNKPIFSHEEVVALRQATISMQTIGRNINHIAMHYASGTITEADKLTQEQLAALGNNFINYSNRVSKLIVTCNKRFGIKCE
jgi:hypothetical protein